LVRLFSFLIAKETVPVTIDMGGARTVVPAISGAPFDTKSLTRPARPVSPSTPDKPVTVTLERLAWGRSGDKGDSANIGIIARNPEAMPYIWSHLTEDAVAARFSHVLEGDVTRYFMPGPCAINFVLTRTLGGGGVASLRNDALGKGFAQVLLQTPITVPHKLIEVCP
jgi:hypothetical protein